MNSIDEDDDENQALFLQGGKTYDLCPVAELL